MVKFVIAPMSGWEENFSKKEEALARAKEIIEKDEEGMASQHGYINPEHLIDEAWEGIEEMYEVLGQE